MIRESNFDNISQWVQHWAILQPDKTAFTFLGESTLADDIETVSYARLFRKSTDIAAMLQSLGQPGDRVILTYRPGLEFIYAFLGCVQAGFIAVPVYPPGTPQEWPRFVKIVINSDAKLICTTSDLERLSQAGIAMTPQLAGIQVIATDAIEPVNDTVIDCGANADSIAFLQYTSGSTGNPKGVMLTHGNLHHNEQLIQQAFSLQTSSTVVCWLPQYHDMGLIGNILGTLFNGMHTVLMSPLSFLKQPFRWLKAISDYQAQVSGGPNFSYELCVKKISAEERLQLDLSQWRLAYNGAEPIRASTLKKFTDYFTPCGFEQRAFMPVYGLAESALLVTHHPRQLETAPYKVDANSLAQHRPQPAVDGGLSKTLIGCGAAPEQRLIVVDPETRKTCADNTIGEIWIQGNSVAQGYWKNPEASQETFQAFTSDTSNGPFLRTGDLGFLKQDQLFVTGRLKEMLIVDGRNLYPQDIEETIQSINPVFRVGCGAVFATEDENSVIAVQELASGTALDDNTQAQLAQATLRAVNQQHQIALAHFILIEPGSLLKTSSGKIRRNAMAQAYSKEKLNIVSQYQAKDLLRSSHAPQSKTETPPPSHYSHTHYENIIVAVVANTLNLETHQINTQIPFSDFGLDSKTLVGMVGTLETQLQQTLTPQLFFDFPSINKLAQHLHKGVNEHAQQEHTSQASRDIAIIGIGCRFPGQVNSADDFWECLVSGTDAIIETPASRWQSKDYYDRDINAPGKMSTKWGGYLQRPKDFDANFFGIKAKEAVVMDPQQRVLLETSWHALEQAGINPQTTAGSNTGVFVGISNVDYDRHCSQMGASSDPYVGTGNATAIAANRLSYFYDWRGPSVALDTACSSSLVAIHQACQSLKNGECDVALAAAVNLILSPDLSITFSKSGMMSADGRCKPFDNSADGYVRSEGCAVILLKDLQQAEADNDKIIAVIKGSALTQDGRSNGITAPNGPAQVATIAKALAAAKLSASDIQYVEAHGTGTPLGDPIELQALAQAYAKDRVDPLLIGSAKSNLGHLEAAAGMVGIIKSALSLQHEILPKTLHFNNPNTHFDWQSNKLKVVAKNTPWPVSATRIKRAGISSFGFGGSNAHIILEQYRKPPENISSLPISVESNNTGNQLFCLSAKDRSALHAQIRSYITFLGSTDADFNTLCASQNCLRTQFEERLAIKCDSVASLKDSLLRLNWAKPDSSIFCSHRRKNVAIPKVAFMFTGQGSQHFAMGKELYQTNSRFQHTIDQCHQYLADISDINLISFITGETGTVHPNLIDQTDYTQPILFCFEYALAQILIGAGFQPDTVMGHSLGELVAATTAGVFKLKDGIKLAHCRGQLMQTLKNKGSMMAVFAHKEDVIPLIKPFKHVSIGALNGPGQVVLSGCSDSLLQLQTEFNVKEIETRNLNVSHGFHSPLMLPILHKFREVLSDIQFGAATCHIVSNISGAIAGKEITSVEYWCKHVIATVNFQASLQTIAKLDHETLIEIGPKATLSTLAKRNLARNTINIIPVIADPNQEQDSLQSALAQCYVAGHNLNWQRLLEIPKAARINLPLYPFQRKYYWLDRPNYNTPMQGRIEPASAFHPLLGKRQFSPYLKSGEMHFIAYPGLDSTVWASAFKQRKAIQYHLNHFLEMSIEIGHEAFKTNLLTVQDLALHHRMNICAGENHSIHSIVEKRALNELRIHYYSPENNKAEDTPPEQWTLLCSATVGKKHNSNSTLRINFSDMTADLTEQTDMPDFYKRHQGAGVVYCCNEKDVVCSTHTGDQEMVATLDFSALEFNHQTKLWLKNEVMHAVYQAVGYFCEHIRKSNTLRSGMEFVPYSVRNITWHGSIGSHSVLHLSRVNYWTENAEHIELNATLYDANGLCLLQIDGLCLKSKPRPQLNLAEKVRQVSTEDRIELITNLIANSLASNIGCHTSDLDLERPIAELAVDSISIIATLAHVKNELQIEIGTGEIHKATSLNDFAHTISCRLASHDDEPMETVAQGACVMLRKGEPGILPLFLIHPDNSSALQYLDLANAFGADIPLYVMLPELLDQQNHARILSVVVSDLVADIQKQQPHGPYMIAGWSLGSTLAMLIATELCQHGEEIRFVGIIDGPCLFNHGLTHDILLHHIEQLSATHPDSAQRDQTHYLQGLQQAYAQALKLTPPASAYELKHFQTDSEVTDLIQFSSLQEWSKYSTRRIHSYTIPGDHFSLLKSGNVETLSSFLRKQMRLYASVKNRFLLNTYQNNGLICSLLRQEKLDKNTHTYTATLNSDEEHPYFYDHELDHVPGILILAGAWELICRTTMDFDPCNPFMCREISACSLSFDRFAEKNSALQYHLQCRSGNAHSIALECHITQNDQTLGRLYIELNYLHRAPLVSLPTCRQILPDHHESVHKNMDSNILINEPICAESGWECIPQAPEIGHYLQQTTLAYNCINPLYILESSRQFLTFLSHQHFGVESGTHVNLIDIQIKIDDSIDFSKPVKMLFPNTHDTPDKDQFKTISVLWMQEGRVIANNQITAQVARHETYHQQRSRLH